MSLRKTGVIRAPQRSPPPNRLGQYTSHGLAPDIRFRAADITWRGSEQDATVKALEEKSESPNPKAQLPRAKPKAQKPGVRSPAEVLRNRLRRLPARRYTLRA